MSRRTSRLLIVTVILIAGGLGVVLSRTSPNPERLLQMARKELAQRNLVRAESLARQVADSHSEFASWGAIVAAEAAFKQDAPDRALAYYQRVPPGPDEAGLSAQYGVAEILAHLGRLSESEQSLRQILANSPSHVLANYRLAFILNITGRRWEAARHLLVLVKSDSAEMEHLLLLGNTERTIDDRALLAESRKLVPDDPLPLLGLARLELTLSHPSEGRRLLEQVRQQLPDDPEVAVRWGQILLDSGSRDDFLEWNAGLAPESETHPETWLLRGLFWQRENQPRRAVRCFWEALRRDPELRHAHYQLGQILSRLGDPRANGFLKRAKQLLSLTLVLDDLFHSRSHLASVHQAADLTEQMGRLWEARAWAILAITMAPNAEWAFTIVQRVEAQLTPDIPQTIATKNLALTTDLSEFPLPIWPEFQKHSTTAPPEGVDKEIRFRDDSSALGPELIYYQSPDPSTPGARIFETTGGGVGVIDYDNDLWPDLYFTQGSEFPEISTTDSFTPARKRYRDQLRRNVHGLVFQAVTESAHLGDEHFSQGVTVGDFDNDGFQDLYVANLGQNRLYHNQGDGTFREITAEAGLTDNWWTTSCLMADLNGDSLPDLYDVNYVVGENLTTLMCEKQGLPRSCSPRAFSSAMDHVWLNLGNGKFRNVTNGSGVELPNGYGLGVVAANFADNNRLSLFIANDEVPNFFFVNRFRTGDQNHHALKFEELGSPSGLAVDSAGASQACMGVAAGDADGDGLLDLFVTNFYNESNTLYRQTGALQFTDETRQWQLRDPGFTNLGFGTQFLDADQDGWQDLVVANGHIDDLTDAGEPWQMPIQFFRNQGRGTFREQPAPTLGPLFEKQYLGRGLARLDWNRDGREDFCVSTIGTPAVLATNETQTDGHFLSLRLIGRTTARDAIGSRIEIQAGGRPLVRELVAGDGYQASNERVVNIGLGKAEAAESVTIIWLNGIRQTFANIPAGQELLIIEGINTAWSVRKGP